MDFKIIILASLVGGTFAKSIDCSDIQQKSYTSTGTYEIFPYKQRKGILVRCDMDTSTGGWTVIQRRISDSDFYKNWQEYKDGFGDLKTNFWLGNENIHQIVRQGRYELRVDLTSSDGQKAYAEYREFSIGDEHSGYKLYASGYSGTAGDAFTLKGNGMKFSTYDKDNDVAHNEKCAVRYHGAWWYEKCHVSNLNGDYGNTGWAIGPVWYPWKGHNHPMKATEMKIRRICCCN
ncbi:ficolin-2-like [Ruditapes philippinarum]|uniref:ficolin-2-like n=1 Tax=Ruditapes philippinarum TaxID=129788 RepID=UPI00295BEB19|nr:ficolin-2-like [Ruditapes philippinarum]